MPPDDPRPSGGPAGPGDIEPLEARLRRWTGAGLITTEQASAILAAERGAAAGPAPPAKRTRFAVELLGYLGGTLAAAGALLLAAQLWPELATWSRLTLLGMVAVVLWAAGALVLLAPEKVGV
jgi:uncharacterized membrane protein